MRRYPVANPWISEREISEVTNCLREGRLTQGTSVLRFEAALAEFLDIDPSRVIACSSGTAALHLALAVLMLERGDEVLVPNLSFVATANAVSYTGATPVLVDIDADTWNISLADARLKVTSRTKAIVPVHLYGTPCNMDAVLTFADEHNLFVIEDAAEALGGKWGTRACGTFGICGTFSFYVNKIITTIEGGAVVTQDDDIANTLRSLRGQAQHPGQRYFHTEIGFNYRFTEIQASLGLVQLEQINKFLLQRRRVIEGYENRLGDVLINPHVSGSAPWMYTALLPITSNYFGVEERLAKSNIEVRPVFVPMNQLPMYKQPELVFPISTHVAQYGITLPTSVDLNDGDVAYISKRLLEAL